MNKLLFVLVICTVIGCKSQPAAVSGSAATSPLTQKLQGMTPAQRTEYAKSHLSELSASAGVSQVPTKKP